MRPCACMLRNGLADWSRDERGTLTIEFIVWLPLLLFWFVISASYFQVHKSRNDAQNVAHTLTDIMSRQVEVNNEFFDELYQLQDVLLPNAPAGATVRVTSIKYDEANARYVVLWSHARGGPEAYPAGEISSTIFPEMANGDTIILLELTVPYTAFTNWDGIGDRTWSFTLFTRPRFVSAIPYVS